MKKRLFVLLLTGLCIGILVAAAVLMLSPAQGDVANVEIEYGNSQFFTDREQQDAAEALMKEFKKVFPDYCLTEIWYISDLRQLEYSRDMDCEERNIIYISDMERKETASEEILPEQYFRYRWCVAQNEAGRWYVFDHGF